MRTALPAALACLLLPCPLLAQPSAAQAPEDPLQVVREALETPFREQTGIAFRDFECELPRDLELSGISEFSCLATDEEGDRFTYRLWRTEENPNGTISQWQPPEQVPTSVLQPLTRTAERFLQAFAEADWEAAAATRDPSLAEAQTREALAEALTALRQRVGEVVDFKLMLFGEPGPGTHALEYRVDSSMGPLLARIRLRSTANDAAITGYLITPEDATPLAAAMLREQASLSLGPLLGTEVESLKLDLEQLAQAGDTTVGEVTLVRGTPVAVLVSRVGTRYDYSQNDYRFSILDVPWMIARHEVENGRPDSEVRCPRRIAEDGGSIDCEVLQPDGSRTAYRVYRRGGEHRLAPASEGE